MAEEPLDASVVETIPAARQTLDHPVLLEWGGEHRQLAPSHCRDRVATGSQLMSDPPAREPW